MPGKAFEKFIVHKESGARKKERIRQEKKKWKQESRAFHEKKKQEARSGRGQKPVASTQQPGKPAPAKKTAPEIVKKGGKTKEASPVENAKAAMPLNKYIAHAGVCSRRDAAGLVKEGKVTGWLMEDGAPIKPGDAILEVETDKIAGAVEAHEAGVLRRRVGQPDTIYPVKTLLGVVADPSVSDAERPACPNSPMHARVTRRSRHCAVA